MRCFIREKWSERQDLNLFGMLLAYLHTPKHRYSPHTFVFTYPPKTTLGHKRGHKSQNLVKMPIEKSRRFSWPLGRLIWGHCASSKHVKPLYNSRYADS